jgi:molybdopterin synthase sulfur carrier subunit
VKVLYFAWLRQTIGIDEEDVDPPASVTDVDGLIAWLKARGGSYAKALEDPSMVRVAVNQEYVKGDHSIAAGDEVALFPPVTGGAP